MCELLWHFNRKQHAFNIDFNKMMEFSLRTYASCQCLPTYHLFEIYVESKVCMSLHTQKT